MKFKNHFNSIPDKGITLDPVSLTIPDQTLSLNEILRRHQLGLPLTVGNKVSLFSENPEQDLLQGVDIRTLDLAEVLDLKAFASQRITELQQQASENIKNNKKKTSEKIAKEKADLITEVLGKVPTNVDQSPKA